MRHFEVKLCISHDAFLLSGDILTDRHDAQTAASSVALHFCPNCCGHQEVESEGLLLAPCWHLHSLFLPVNKEE